MNSVSASTISDYLRFAAEELAGFSEDPRREAEILLCAVLECDRAYVFAFGEKLVDQTARDIFLHYIARRKEGEPVAYILGRREFWSLLLSVNDSTLIPRPDTEVLVESALQYCQHEEARVIDLGTGTGAIALALASEKPGWKIDAVDVSAEAVELARFNAKQLSLGNVTIYQSNWFDAVSGNESVLDNGFDLVVSNPPYIAAFDPHLSNGDVRFEPHSALIAADSGYADLFYIAREARNFLRPDGFLLLEHGFDQAVRLRQYLCDLGYVGVQTINDFGGNERVAIARWPRGV